MQLAERVESLPGLEGTYNREQASEIPLITINGPRRASVGHEHRWLKLTDVKLETTLSLSEAFDLLGSMRAWTAFCSSALPKDTPSRSE